MSHSARCENSVANDVTSPNSVVQFLTQPSSFSHGTSSVELKETHISWVFLTDHFVYKLKKPVKFEFLDFTTMELRHAACLEELHLNRRLAADVYLEVIPISKGPSGNLQLGKPGDPLDWVVKMRRLPSDKSMDVMIQGQILAADDVDRIAETLCKFYQSLTPIPISEEEYVANIRHHLLANAEELRNPDYELDTWMLKRIHAGQMRFLAVDRGLFLDRLSRGRIVDGHGDLRPEHVYVEAKPKVIDCVEFNPEFRKNDVADELAFLAMECDRLKANWVGQTIVSRYTRVASDPIPRSLFDFFKSYRACVRAKVSALRSHQTHDETASKSLAETKDYLQLADRYSQSLGPPMLIVVRGLSGSGKSTVAAALEQRYGCDCIDTDGLRREIFGKSTERSEFGSGNYTPNNRLRIYEELFRLASDHLSHGASLILDGTFLDAKLRTRAIVLAHQLAAIPLIVHCSCPPEVAKKRIQNRQAEGNSNSEFQVEFSERQRTLDEPDNVDWPVVRIDTSEDLSQNLRTVDAYLRGLISRDSPGE